MKILLTQRKLAAFAGTEMITLELACSLKKRGHDIAVYCPRPGRVVDLLASNGVATYTETGAIPWRPDVIHGQHHLPAMTALTAFDGVPAIYACHGVRPWVEQPPLHPQIKSYVAVSGKMATYITTTYPIAEQFIRIIPNFVDTDRFSTVRTPSDDPPRTALLFGQRFSPEEVQLLEDACVRNDLKLDKIGGAFGNVRPNPELFLPDYDIVFAIGRSALEAMACGCATIPIMPHLAGKIVTTANFNDWVDRNFSPRYFTTGDRISPAWFAEQLANLDVQDVAKVTNTVRREFTIEKTTDRFEALYRQVADQPVSAGTQEALVSYLEKLAVEADENWETKRGAEVARARQDTLLKNQSAALREAQRQLDFLTNCILSAPGGVANEPGSDDWIAAIEGNGLFDREWYLATNPDVAEAGLDPLVHYINHGAEEGRKPSPSFDCADPDPEIAHLYKAGSYLMQNTARQLLALAETMPREKKAVWRDGSMNFQSAWRALTGRQAKK
jgi:glycosyltransferase involved in cell wall biosynthesis